MNKREFIEVLKEKTMYTEEQCQEINQILENHFIFSKKNKSKVVDELVEKIGVSDSEAEKIYEIAMEIISSAMKNKRKHPFQSQD